MLAVGTSRGYLSCMTTSHAFEQNIIALVWDFDKTLITDYMQAPLFKRYQADSGQFWKEVDGLAAFYERQGVHVNKDIIYLNHILSWVDGGPLNGLSNKVLREMGTELKFYPGLPDFFLTVKETIERNAEYAKFGIRVEHYIVSTGFAETIRGSVIAPHAEHAWGAEFIEHIARPGYGANEPIPEPRQLRQVACALDNTSKTRYLFEINKGTNKHPEIELNARILPENRRVPFANMVYIADGPSDVPAFSIVNQGGGSTYAIYPRGDADAMRQVDQLRSDDRIQMYGEADYTPGAQTHMWLLERARRIADRIVETKQDLIRRSVSTAPRHLGTTPKKGE